MIHHIIEYCARNRLLVLLLTGFLTVLGLLAVFQTKIDALPDLSDVQVIIETEYMGQAPQIVEEQVTYPLTTAMLAVPRAKTVRGFSMFGTSMVYVIFEDGTDLYWARSRVLEYLNYVNAQLPSGVRPAIGPDATGLGWVYQYSIEDPTGQHDLAELRALQDYYLKYELQSVEGVSEVASVGGFVKQYQVLLDPYRLANYRVTPSQVQMALETSNADVGGRTIELSEREFMVRGKGYLKGVEDIRKIPVKSEMGIPLTVGDVARVQIGPELRRGIADVNGEYEAVGGIVVMRYGENAQAVIQNVKNRIEQIKAGLPKGVRLVTEYDRSRLIKDSVQNLQHKIWEELLVVALVIFIFLLHVRSAFVALITVPVGLLMSFLCMYVLGVNANIMSLGGLAIAIGVMVDAALVMVENAHKKLESYPIAHEADRITRLIEAAKEVGPSLFFSLLIVTLSFLPVFALEEVEGRLFRPLALTKTFAMAAGALLSITLIPALMTTFIRGKIRHERENPVSRFFMNGYRPMLRGALKHPKPVLIIGFSLLLFTLLPLQRTLLGRDWIPFPQIGAEFMPALEEGDLLYMPTTLPGVSPQKAKELLQTTDRILKRFPEVRRVFGKVGRAQTTTDPAPLSMLETTIILKPKSEWRVGMTMAKLTDELNAAIRIPGLTNAWTMPIRNRIDMLATGMKTPVGIKIAGADLKKLDELGGATERILRPVQGTRSVLAERSLGGYFVDLEIKRDEAARYGLTTGDIQDVMQVALGGMTATTTVEGLARFPVNIRYEAAYRDNLPALRALLLPTPMGAPVPLGQVADVKLSEGASMIKSEDAKPNVWIYIDLAEGQDVGSYVQRADARIRQQLSLPAGYSMKWSGQFEYIERANNRLRILIPITLGLVFLLLFLHFRTAREALLLMIPLPFSVVGAVWLLVIMGYNLSIAVWVGFIATIGLAAETGIVMHVYLDEALKRYKRTRGELTRTEVLAALEEGAVERLRPKLMTVITAISGLIPIMFGAEEGSAMMQHIAAPMIGGLVTSAIHTLIMIPALYAIIQTRSSQNLTS